MEVISLEEFVQRMRRKQEEVAVKKIAENRGMTREQWLEEGRRIVKATE